MKTRKRKRKARLYVDFKSPDLGTLGLPDPPESWTVNVDDPKSPFHVILWGFIRQKDAEIAMVFLTTIPTVDWLAPSQIMWRQLAAVGYPDRDSLMQAACERLQW